MAMMLFSSQQTMLRDLCQTCSISKEGTSLAIWA